ncbi:MAG TPA: glycosyltransferase [Tepidisphaeraceae bacterium]|nr:glycosyltransferase [Tepidisphaeraceae bacterium]
MSRIRVVHIINSFEYGGAEAMLCNLLLRSDTSRFEQSVVSLIDDMTVAGDVVRAGIPIVTMGMRPGLPDPRAIVRLALHLRRVRPDVVQTWMDHSNLIGGIAARAVRGCKVVWGVHHSNHVRGITKRSTLLTVSACARLSRRVPHRIVSCSRHAGEVYERLGFDRERMCVVPNGFDTSAFCPDETGRRRIRRECGLEEGATVIGLVARYDPVKDHAGFLRAAAALLRTHPHVRFLLCGQGVDDGNADLRGLVASLGIERACTLLGPRRDVADVYRALDVATSSSLSEAFPLAVGEAMACGVPCAVTDVGDSRLIVGDTGQVAPPRDPDALAAAWTQILAMPPEQRRQLGAAARERIVRLFDLTAVTRRYEQLYAELHAPVGRVGATREPMDGEVSVTA